MSEEMMYQNKKKQPLYRELEAQLKKTEGNKELHYWSNEPLKTEKGKKLSDKLQGLARLSIDVGAYGKVVSADMLTDEIKQEYKTNYGLSRKEMERMLGDMQAGTVGVSEVPEGVELRKSEYALFASIKRSTFAQKETEQHQQAFEELGELLREKRKTGKTEIKSYQMAELTKNEMLEFRRKYTLSEKELKRMVLDLQTGAVQTERYDHTPLETERRRKEEALRQKREEAAEMEHRREAKAVQRKAQILREDTDKRKARRIYLETGITKEGAPQVWVLAPYVNEVEQVLIDMGDPMEPETVMQYTKEIEARFLDYRKKSSAALQASMQGYEALPAWLKREQTARWQKEWEEENIVQILRIHAEEVLIPLTEERTAELVAHAERSERIAELGRTHGINITAIDCMQVRELYALEQEAFENRIQSLNQQIFHNMFSMRNIVKKAISPLNQARVQQELAEKQGEALLFGGPAQVAAVVSEYLSKHLPEEVRTSEQNVDAALDYFERDAFLTAAREHPEARLSEMPYDVWKKHLFAVLKPEQELSKMKQMVDYVVTKVWANRCWFYEDYPKTEEYIKELPVGVWQDLFQYCEDNILMNGFKKEVPKRVKELLQQYKYTVDEKGRLHFEPVAEVSSREDYIEEYEERRRTELELKEPDFSNQYLLKNEGFLRNEEFGQAFVRYEEVVLRELERLLKKKAFQVKGVDLHKVEVLEDLESLPYLEFSLFLNHLCRNVRKAFHRWEKLECYEKNRIKSNLLPALLSGTLTEENFTESVERELEKVQKREAIPELRIPFMLESEQDMFRSAFVYAGAEGSLLRERKTYFASADRAWQILRENGMEREALKECIAYRKKPYNLSMTAYQEDNPARPIKLLLRSVQGRDQEEAKKLAQELDRESSKNFMNEFLLCGQQNRMMDKRLYPGAEKKLSAQYPQAYERQKALIELGKTAEQLDLLLRVLDRYHVPQEEQERYRQKMLPVLMILADGTISDKEKWERFGVSTYLEALTELEHYLIQKGFQASAEWMEIQGKEEKKLREKRSWAVSKNEKAYRSMDAEEKQAMLAGFKERETQLSAYRGGIFKPILPHIFRNDALWMSMLTLDEQGFADKLEDLYQRMEVPLILLKRRYSSLGKDFYEQLCDLFAPAILYGEQKDRLGWMNYFDAFFDIYCKTELQDFSVRKLMEKFRKDDPVLPYLTMILLTNPKGLGLLKHKIHYKSTIDACRQHIQDNEAAMAQYLETYFSEHSEQMQTESVKNAFTKGFQLYLEQEILWKEKDEFNKLLPERMKAYEADRQAMQTEQNQTEADMERHREVLADIQAHREAGLQADIAEQKLFRELREGLHNTGSPMLAALGVQMRPGETQLRKAREKLAGRGELPEAVQNCLLERMLSNVTDEQLREEESWLKNAHRQIEAYIHTLSAQLRSQMPSMEQAAEELLMHMYIRQLQRGKMEELAENDAQMAYQALSERHASMLLLLNSRQQKVDIQQPELRRLNVNTEDNPALAMKRQMVTEAMAVGMYTMNRKQFKEIIVQQAHYFAAAEFADQIIAGCIKTYTPDAETDADPIPEEQQMTLRRALLEYFREDLKKTKDVNTLELQAKVDEMLRDASYRRYLLSGVLMDGMDGKSLLNIEKTMQSVADCSMLEEFLSQKVNAKFAKAYSGLTRTERQVFALTVLLKRENSMLPSAKFIHSEEVEESRKLIIHKQLQDYMDGKAFHAEIDYEKVTDSLRMSNGRVQEVLFGEAMEQTKKYTAVYMKKHRNFELLNDTALSIQQADRVLKRDTPYRAVNVNTTEELQKWIMAQDRAAEQSDEQIAQTKQRLSRLNAYQMNLLAAMLNDRTMLDITLCDTETDAQSEFVNMEKRNRFKEEFVKAPFVYSRMLKEAAKTLHSFQLRDDVPLSHRYLAKEDFAPGALERKSTLDWTLLSHALDFVEECSK